MLILFDIISKAIKKKFSTKFEQTNEKLKVQKETVNSHAFGQTWFVNAVQTQNKMLGIYSFVHIFFAVD